MESIVDRTTRLAKDFSSWEDLLNSQYQALETVKQDSNTQPGFLLGMPDEGDEILVNQLMMFTLKA